MPSAPPSRLAQLFPGALLTLGAACSAPPPTQAPSPADAESMAIFAVEAPRVVELDGELGEWGDLRPIRREQPRVASHRAWIWPPVDERTLGASPSSDAAAPGAPERPVLPNTLVGDASRVAVALTSEALWVVGELEDTTAEAVWLGVGVDPPEAPELGWRTRSGSGFVPLSCEQRGLQQCDGLPCIGDDRTPDEEIERCEQARLVHADFVRRHELRFHKLVRIEASTAFEHEASREKGGKPTEHPLPEAEVVWRRDEHRARFEARLPLSALPRLAEAPLRSLNLYARTTRRGASVDEAIATMPAAKWWRSWLPRPVSFEPLAELRHALYGLTYDQPVGPQSTPHRPMPALSYDPGAPREIEFIEADAYGSERRTGPILRVLTRFGAVEVGRARAAHDYLVLSTHRGLRAIVDLGGAAPSKLVERAGELHVVTPVLEPWRGEPGAILPRWSVIGVSAEGTLRDLLAGVERDLSPPSCWRFEKVRLSPEEDLERFAVRGECVEEPGGKRRPIELVVRWDARRRAYVGGTWQAPERR